MNKPTLPQRFGRNGADIEPLENGKYVLWSDYQELLIYAKLKEAEFVILEEGFEKLGIILNKYDQS